MLYEYEFHKYPTRKCKYPTRKCKYPTRKYKYTTNLTFFMVNNQFHKNLICFSDVLRYRDENWFIDSQYEDLVWAVPI